MIFPEKKFLWPHGITPPLKNVRKKRFRKTLKKKYVDFPEIEKEVKRLFRTDNEAIHVRYEVVNVDDEERKNTSKKGAARGNASYNGNSASMNDVGEHDLFGDVVSSSDEEDTRAPVVATDDESSRLSVSNREKADDYITEFPQGILSQTDQAESSVQSSYDIALESSNAAAAIAALEEANAAAADSIEMETNENHELIEKLRQVEREIEEINNKIAHKETETEGIENIMLKNRFKAQIDQLKNQAAQKRQERDELINILNS